MNAGRILCSILLGMYAIYIIPEIIQRTIAGANTKKSLLLTMIQLSQLLMLELMVIFGGRILHSFSIFSLILAVLLWGNVCTKAKSQRTFCVAGRKKLWH
ncbi:MAG: hypothetical protein ACLTJ8_07695 [Veillonella atypica]